MAIKSIMQLDLIALKNQIILITGATGLIGKELVRYLLQKSYQNNLNIQIIAPVRNISKAQKLLKDYINDILFLQGDITNIDLTKYVPDYIIHCASQTASKAFVNEPVETIHVIVDGTKNLLELACKVRSVKRFVFISTMEVYGTPQNEDLITESHSMEIDSMNVRSCYPVSKRMCETLCIAYMKEYGVPINVLRLTQTFGPGVQYNDARVFAEFARCAIENRDIILKTKGETKRAYLYTEDAVKAILMVMVSDNIGEAYNVANPKTYCSILEMAHIVADNICQGKIKVRIEENKSDILGYAPVLYMNLSIDKLRTLGWMPSIGLEEMFIRLIDDLLKQE